MLEFFFFLVLLLLLVDSYMTRLTICFNEFLDEKLNFKSNANFNF